MGLTIQAGFDTFRESSHLTVNADDGFGTLVATVTGSLFPSVSGSIEGIWYASAITEMVAKLNSLGGSWTGGYSHDSNQFFLSSSTSWTITLSPLAAKVFGFTPPGSPVQYLTSSISPWFIWRSNEAGVSKDSGETESETPYREEMSDWGYGFGLGAAGNGSFNRLNRQDGFLERNFTFMNEPIAKVYSAHSASGVPYTWEEHIRHSRAWLPWVLFEHTTASLVTYEDRRGTYRFLGSHSRLQVKPMFRGFSGYWNIDVGTRQLSRGTNFGAEPYLLDGYP